MTTPCTNGYRQLSPFLEWPRKGISNSPPPLDSHGDSLTTYPKFSSPLTQVQCSTHERYFSIAACIVLLLFLCRPPHVSGFVVSVLVWKAIKCSPARPISNVKRELIKGIPLRRNFYSYASILMVVFVLWIVTSLAHVRPNRSKRVVGRVKSDWILSFVSPFFLKVLQCFAGDFRLDAPATFGSSVFKRCRQRYNLTSTVTVAKPEIFSMVCHSLRSNSGEATEFHSLNQASGVHVR